MGWGQSLLIFGVLIPTYEWDFKLTDDENEKLGKEFYKKYGLENCPEIYDEEIVQYVRTGLEGEGAQFLSLYKITNDEFFCLNDLSQQFLALEKEILQDQEKLNKFKEYCDKIGIPKEQATPKWYTSWFSS